jgi:hypothetical protein
MAHEHEQTGIGDRDAVPTALAIPVYHRRVHSERGR